MTWERPVAVGTASMLSNTWFTELDHATRELLLKATDPSTGNISIPINGIFPKFIRLPSTPKAVPVALSGFDDIWHTYQNLTLVRFTSPSQRGPYPGAEEEWWSLHQSGADESPFNTTAEDGLQMVVAADKSVTVSALFSAGGVLAFYAAVVLAIGRTVRAILGGTRYRLVVDEMPDTRDLADLCEGVYLARHAGQLLRETELHETILRLYRSPEALLQLTGGKLKRRTD